MMTFANRLSSVTVHACKQHRIEVVYALSAVKVTCWYLYVWIDTARLPNMLDHNLKNRCLKVVRAKTYFIIETIYRLDSIYGLEMCDTNIVTQNLEMIYNCLQAHEIVRFSIIFFVY